MRTSDPRQVRALALVAYVAAYIALDWVSYIYPVGRFGITPWNPPPGLSLALLLWLGPRYWPALFVAALSAEAVVRGFSGGAAFALGDAAVVACGYGAIGWLLHGPVAVSPRLDRFRDVSRFVIVVAMGSAVVAVAFVGLLAVSGRIDWSVFPRLAFRFWVGDAIGTIVTTPLLLFSMQWARAGFGGVLRNAREVVLQGLTLAAALVAVYWTLPAFGSKFFYVLFLPLTWIAARHGVGGASIALVVIQLGLLAALAFTGSAGATVLEFQLLMLALAIVALALGVVVTERSHAQSELAAREAELASLFRTAPDGILSIDAEGHVRSANAAAGRIFRASAEELTGRRLADLLPGLASPIEPCDGLEWRALRSDGTSFPVELSIGRAGVDGEPRFIGMVRDVTRRKQVEEALRERQTELDAALRLAAAGEMASSLAHELNQPLSAVAAYARASTLLAERPAEERGRLRETLAAVVREVARAADVVRRLRDFFRSGGSRLERVPLGRLVAASVEPLARRLERNRIRLAIDCPDDLPQVLVDRTQLQMVVHNLVANAADAIAGAGMRVREIDIRADRTGPDAVKITVADSGPGVPQQIADALFKPFTTTKSHGMGLGLALSRSIVEAHGGRLVAERAARGAVFSFTLPVHEAEEVTS